MNRLQNETSPYLLQHANNPVDWYAWKPEAFEKAKKENKPILVSIGYSTCHWCHVMERESFEDHKVAAFMNENFINIKVDREERPDVDQIYMDACQAISGAGGWPLNCFLLPDGRPYYAGTYYPPQPVQNRPSWGQVLQHMSKVFREEPMKVEEQANQLTQLISQSDATFFPGSQLGFEKDDQFDSAVAGRIFARLTESFDQEYGGFGGAPKFPSAMSLQFLLEYYFHTREKAALDHLVFSLTKMIEGGIYDQLGGGFARYATDQAWLIPHFEKMLYDNALLVGLLADAYRLTKNNLFKTTIEECLHFIQREMTHSEGGFYSALDADSEGEEGKFYVWDQKEIVDILGNSRTSEIFCYYYGVSEKGNWEGANILWRPYSLRATAEKFDLNEQALHELLNEARSALLKHREQRIRPGLDDKILLNWNALQLIAYAKAYQALQKEEYKQVAEKNYTFIKKAFIQEDGLHFFHTYKDGRTQYDAFLDDYAYWIAALLALYGINFDIRLLEEARKYTELVFEDFLDEDSGLFYYTSARHRDVPVRKKEIFDASIPSGNSTMLHNLRKLARFFDDKKYTERSMEMLANLKQAIEKYPSSFANWSTGLLAEAYPAYEVAVVGNASTSKALELQRHYLPSAHIMAAEAADPRFPLLAGREAGQDALIYVCRQYACQLPQKEVEAAIQQIVGQNA